MPAKINIRTTKLGLMNLIYNIASDFFLTSWTVLTISTIKEIGKNIKNGERSPRMIGFLTGNNIKGERHSGGTTIKSQSAIRFLTRYVNIRNGLAIRTRMKSLRNIFCILEKSGATPPVTAANLWPHCKWETRHRFHLLYILMP